MDVIARNIAFVSNMPDAGEREGGAWFTVDFDVKDGTNAFTIKIDVQSREGAAPVLGLAQAKLLDFIDRLRLEADEGGFGHLPRRLF